MGIPGFFNYLKNNFDNRNNKYIESYDYIVKYDTIILDYQSLFYNIFGLYQEVNYFIRLLYHIKYNMKESELEYHITLSNYIIAKFSNLFTKMGVSSIDPKISLNNLYILVDNIINKFPVSDTIIEEVIINDMIDHTLQLATRYLKTNLPSNMYIYFDSIPSIAKIKEQLTRRINGTILRHITDNVVNLAPDINNKISEKVIRNKMIKNFPGINIDSNIIKNTRIRLTNLGFIVNDVNRYGEAEHMIMQDISNMKFDNMKILLASPDADLILLCLIASAEHPVSFDIYRETTLNESIYNFTFKYQIENDIIVSPYLREIDIILVDQVKQVLSLTTKQKVYDICYLFLILGDDFIPIIPTLSINVISEIFSIYGKLTKQINGYNIINIDTLTLNYTNFTQYIEELAKQESHLEKQYIGIFNKKIKKRITDTEANYMNHKKFFMLNSYDEIIYKKLFYLNNAVQIINDKPVLILTPKYIYKEMHDNMQIKKYLEGCQFIFDLYYLNKINNYKWFYPYESAPSLKELLKYLNKNKDYKQIFNYTNDNDISQYLSITSYKEYMEDNKNKILLDILHKINPNATLDDLSKLLTYDNLRKIYKCHNKLYINGCIDYDSNPIDPNMKKYNEKIDITMLGGTNIHYNKYLKYKTKYIMLKNV